MGSKFQGVLRAKVAIVYGDNLQPAAYVLDLRRSHAISGPGFVSGTPNLSNFCQPVRKAGDIAGPSMKIGVASSLHLTLQLAIYTSELEGQGPGCRSSKQIAGSP